MIKELKKDSGIEVEKNRSSGLPAVSVEMNKQAEYWRRKKVETAMEETKDAEGWIVVGEKKQNKKQTSTPKEKTEMTAIVKKKKCISSELKAQEEEEVKRTEEEGGKNKGSTAGQTNKAPGRTAGMVKTVSSPLISKNLPPANKEKEGTMTEEMQKNFASEFPVKEVAGVMYPTISTYGFKPSEALQMAVTLTPFPDLAKIRKKLGVGNEESSGTSSKVQTMAQNPPSNSNPNSFLPLDRSTLSTLVNGGLVKESEQDVFCLQKGVGENQAEPSDQSLSKGPFLTMRSDQSEGDNTLRQLEIISALDADKAQSAALVSSPDGASEKRNGKALVLAENEIHSLDCSIDLQPSMHLGMSSGPKVGTSEVGFKSEIINSSGPNFLKGRGNLGFEYFKASSPADLQSKGLNSVGGLGQLADSVGGNGKEQPGPSAAGPELLVHDELGLGYCLLNKNANPPSTQSNYQPNINSEDIPSDEDEKNNSSEDSDYFGTYHSDGDFPKDSDWYSEDSESAKFLKEKWRRGYTLRAIISRRSLD